MNSESAVEVNSLTKNYGNRQILQGITFTLKKGLTYFLVGPNGCGKTTVIETMLGLRQQNSGTVSIFGKDPRHAKSILPRIRVSLQGATLHAQVKIKEHLEYMAAVYKVPKTEIFQIVQDFGIKDLLPRKYGKLSGGQQRRTLVAGCLLGQSDLIVLDEPTSGVDIESRISLWSALRSHLKENNTTLLATTHDLNEAEDYADIVLIMRNGLLVMQGRPSQIISKSGLVGVLTLPTLGAKEIAETTLQQSRFALTEDIENTTYSYTDYECWQNDAQWCAQNGVSAHSRTPRLSDAYLFTTERNVEFS